MRFAALVLLSLLSIPPAFAQSKKDWAECSGSNPDKGIAACTRILDRGKDPRNNLAIAHYNRASFLATNKDYDRALGD